MKRRSANYSNSSGAVRRPHPFAEHRQRAQEIAEKFRSFRTSEQTARRGGPGPAAPLTRPRDNKVNVFKRRLYELAWDIDAAGQRQLLENEVRARYSELNIGLRPREWTVVDWTVRLACGWLVLNKRRLATKNRSRQKTELSISDATVSRISTELNFAFQHDIHHELATTFIDDVGGYRYIVSRLKQPIPDLREEIWWLQMRSEYDGGDELEYFRTKLANTSN